MFFIYSFSIASGSSLLSILILPLIIKKINKKFYTRRSTISELEIISSNQIELNITSKDQLDKIVSIHSEVEKFDPKIEEMFKYLQIFTASCDSFSHGANDVANAIGPFAAIYLIYRENGNISKKVNMGNDAYWILGMAGIGIAIGLIVYGKKIINAMYCPS